MGGAVMSALAATHLFGHAIDDKYTKAVSVFLAGLEASGKTTILCKLIRKNRERHEILMLEKKESFKTSPTVGFNVEEIKLCHGTKMIIWDIGNDIYMRNLRARSLEENDALIFVVDASDRRRLNDARLELWRLLQLRASTGSSKAKAPLLILANKQDQPEAIGLKELTNILELKSRLAQTCPWHVQPTCALTGAGLAEALSWLSSKLKKKKRRKIKFDS